MPKLVGITNVNYLLRGVANELCPLTCPPGPNGVATCNERDLSHSVLVPDFQNLDTYVPGSVGLYMGEQMRAALSQQCHSQIVQADFGKYFRLSGDGLAVLTRNPNDIQNEEHRMQDVVVGTYSFQGNKLSLFVRKTQGSTGMIKKMVARDIQYSCQGGQFSIREDASLPRP
ncbi:MAG: FlgO family outer membrane protein [Macromonas sp.]